MEITLAAAEVVMNHYEIDQAWHSSANRRDAGEPRAHTPSRCRVPNSSKRGSAIFRSRHRGVPLAPYSAKNIPELLQPRESNIR